MIDKLLAWGFFYLVIALFLALDAVIIMLVWWGLSVGEWTELGQIPFRSALFVALLLGWHWMSDMAKDYKERVIGEIK